MARAKMRFVFCVVFCFAAIATACRENTRTEIGADGAAPPAKEVKVTFIELGSVNCIPCRAMQAVMKEIAKEFGSQVKIVFYDVWTEAGQPYASHYGIRAIPTQVFLDKDGKEYFRHEGYFSKEELIKVLKMKGVQ